MLTPWIVRNTQVQGTLTLISTNDGSNLYQGNNPCVADYLLKGWDAQWVNCLAPTPPGLSETETVGVVPGSGARLPARSSRRPAAPAAVKFVTLWSPELLPRAVPPDANLDNDSGAAVRDAAVSSGARQPT